MKHNLFGAEIDAIRMGEAVSRLRQWISEPASKCRYVVTPNVDHAVMLQEHAGLRMSYQAADLILADGFPIVWASRLLRKPLPERVPGSELVPALFDAFSQGNGRGEKAKSVSAGSRSRCGCQSCLEYETPMAKRGNGRRLQPTDGF